MKFVVIIVSIFINTLSAQTSTKVSNSAGFSCSDANVRVTELAIDVKRNSKIVDMSNDIDQIKKIISDCKLNIANLGWRPDTFENWRRTGYEAELSFTQKFIEHNSQYIEVNSALENYKIYAQKLGLNSQDVNAYVSKYKKQGATSAISEKNKCHPKIDLRNNVLGPTRDQDSIGWCGGFAAADLLTYKLGKKISAADLAMNYRDGWSDNLLRWTGRGEHDFEGVWADRAIEATKKKGGACLERNLKSEDNGHSTLLSTLIEIDNSKKKSAHLSSRFCYKAVNSMFPNIPVAEYIEISEKATKANFVKMLSDKACKPRIPLNDIEIKTESAKYETDRKPLFDKINEQLEKSNIVAAAYNPEILYSIFSDKESKLHESVVVGRRYNLATDQCEYLIRNSWGRGCDVYDSVLKCEEGNIWVPKSVLAKGISNVSYIK
ncbi:MAG: hypothetical protein A2Z20_00105 [Bdellovibrionales bacterium RBG_16_40_8]|nr:MAG: hypothetical protein A2Z20_00105 [Bdellovibrionales bacterium RBG_16_40_8]